MTDSSARDFYDSLAPDYHRIFADWDASMAHQAAALGALLGPGPHRVLDCACGIGTQAIGLALAGHRVVGSDLSPVAAARAAVEASARGALLPTAAADMRRLPFAPGVFDVVVCADNSVAHLLTAPDVGAALAGMRRVLRDDGLLLLTLRDYDEIRRTRPGASPPQVSGTSDDRVVTFQLWHWHEDGERYDVEHFQLVPGDGDGWAVRVRRTTSWALTRSQLTEFVTAAGFTGVRWHDPAAGGFYQPVLTARAA
ncbi:MULTISPECIES: class I SAM-dependent methyltransferase [unclassified Streptomyces]|uniref:class I SAM-dependent methyltransferase n=1 Tax=unclassified Streptomyces TaxID=2593676 RepID=UPI001BAF6CC2|nr:MULTISPECIES: class I SAM-dependent methyltransferase [unclassified Streptomyces]MDH6447765.1 SAM-dependent methyltransferase [Streptomyces sp. SAI-119]MDH6501511.1 SAM-dependent methyltransferase [Streptomyces sp. SAI-149]QUC60060.1 class I SAM-dependent methyltransferase [Streptomyces sp. A2-16]